MPANPLISAALTFALKEQGYKLFNGEEPQIAVYDPNLHRLPNNHGPVAQYGLDTQQHVQWWAFVISCASVTMHPHFLVKAGIDSQMNIKIMRYEDSTLQVQTGYIPVQVNYPPAGF